MTHATYSQQQLRCKSLPQLKRIYSEIGCTLEVTDKRYKEEWTRAITSYQSSQLQKIDEQDIAQGKLNQYIATQSEVVAPFDLTIREIDFFECEIFHAAELIAIITMHYYQFIFL